MKLRPSRRQARLFEASWRALCTFQEALRAYRDIVLAWYDAERRGDQIVVRFRPRHSIRPGLYLDPQRFTGQAQEEYREARQKQRERVIGYLASKRRYLLPNPDSKAWDNVDHSVRGWRLKTLSALRMTQAFRMVPRPHL